MEEIKADLIEIIKEQLTVCKNNNTVPSKEVLDTINTLVNTRDWY